MHYKRYEILQQQTLLNYFKIRNRLQLIFKYFFYNLKLSKKQHIQKQKKAKLNVSKQI